MTPSTYPWIEELGLHDTLDAIASSGRGVLFGHPAEARELTRRVLSRVPRTSEDLEAHRQILGVQLPKRQREALAVGLEGLICERIVDDPHSTARLLAPKRWGSVPNREVRDIASSAFGSLNESRIESCVATLLALSSSLRSRWIAAVAVRMHDSAKAAIPLFRRVASDALGGERQLSALLNLTSALVRSSRSAEAASVADRVSLSGCRAVDEAFEAASCIAATNNAVAVKRVLGELLSSGVTETSEWSIFASRRRRWADHGMPLMVPPVRFIESRGDYDKAQLARLIQPMEGV